MNQCNPKKFPSVLALSCLAIACSDAYAQPKDLPDSLSGRWTWPQRRVSQTFSLDEIKARPDGSLTANLTWWTIDPKCALRGAPVVGKHTAAGLTFEATTKSDVAFTATLERAQKGWVGKAKTTSGTVNVVELDLVAD